MPASPRLDSTPSPHDGASASRRWWPRASATRGPTRPTASISTTTCCRAFGRRRIGLAQGRRHRRADRELRAAGRSAKTTASALATLQSVLRFARRRGWILADPVELLEPEERPRPAATLARTGARPQRSPACSSACPSRRRLLVETALFSGMRISELLGPTWADIDFAAGLIRVRAQLSRASSRRPSRGGPAQDARFGRARSRWFPNFPTASPRTDGPRRLPHRPTGSS